MTTERSSSRSNSTADSDIGRLISLTSKSEVRYEGDLGEIRRENILCNTIAEQNIRVRSFETLGWKTDAPQAPLSDKLLDYVLFPGSDIKDLQVKSSPPVQPTPASPIHDDPVVMQNGVPFQTHYGQRGREMGRGAWGQKKGVFESLDNREVDAPLREETKRDDNEDEEEEIWEELQFRKGLGKRLDDGTTSGLSAYRAPAVSYGPAPSIGAIASPPPNIGGAMAAGLSIPRRGEVAMKTLCDYARRLEDSHTKTMSSLAKTDEKLSLSWLKIAALEKSLFAAGKVEALRC